MRTLVLPALLLWSGVHAQTLTPTLLTAIDNDLNETSGLLVLDGQVWTQLDSGNPNALYEVDAMNGSILRTVTNASNVDWEDITANDGWLYIGDFGNNAGARTDLRVFRIPLAALLDPDVTDVQADTIRFAYADQTDFTPADHANNWDCEAMVAMDDSLFLFSKNWLDQRSYLYVLPAGPGDHLAVRRDTLDAQGLITGATYDSTTGAIALCGYSPTLMPFVWWLHGFSGHTFFDGVAERHPVQLPFTQVEGIAWSTPGRVHLSNEHGQLSAARLWDLELGSTTAIAPVHTTTTEAPVLRGNTVVFGGDVEREYLLLDVNGRTVRSGRTSDRRIVLRDEAPGAYVLRSSSGGKEQSWRFVYGR